MCCFVFYYADHVAIISLGGPFVLTQRILLIAPGLDALSNIRLVINCPWLAIVSNSHFKSITDLTVYNNAFGIFYFL